MADHDAQDEQLVALLAHDARLSIAELGRRVGLSRTATLARVRRLERSGVIRGYHADIAPTAAPQPHRARIGIVTSTRDRPAYVRRLERSFADELTEVESVAGEYDLLVGVAVASPSRLDSVLDTIGGWRETVRTMTFVVLSRRVRLPEGGLGAVDPPPSDG